VLILSASAVRADDFAERFRDPPGECGMTVYWAWFGPAVTREGIDRDLQNMRKAHISGATILPVYPLAADDEAKGIHNQPFLSGEFLEMLAYTAQRARELGMTLDVTLGTGWPYGGPWISPELGARMIRQRKAADPLQPGEEIVTRVGEQVIVSVPTRMKVKRAALGGEGLVHDPYNAAALRRYLEAAGEKLHQAVGKTGIRSYWCDSLEIYDANWTTDFPDQFQRLRGYDLTPRLPLLFGEASAEAKQVRRDYWRTLSESAAENFYKPLQQWCRDKGVTLRAEPYGQPPVSLGSFQYVDRPVGEHYEWRMLNATRWAAAGGHLHGKNVIDAEAWTWTGLPNRFADSLEQLKLASDMHLVSGANSLMAVSYIYAPPGADKAYWLSYWGPFLNERQPWWSYFPLLSRYVQRASWLLQQGKPVAEVGVYLPIDDVFAATPADRGLNLYFDVRERLHGKPIPEFGLKNAMEGDTPVLSTLIRGGYGFDCMDSTTLPKAKVAGRRLQMGLCDFALVVLPGVEGMPLSDLEKLAEFVRAGGTVLATKRLPDLAYGPEHKEDTQRLRQLVRELFGQPTYGSGRALLVKDEREAFTAALNENLSPDLKMENSDPDIAFVHRQLPDQDFYFVANLGQQEKKLAVQFAAPGKSVQVWDPMTGAISDDWDGSLRLDPFGSLAIRISANPAVPPERHSRQELRTVTAPGPWTLQIPNRAAISMEKLHLWTEHDELLHFSGTGAYESAFDLELPARTHRVLLDLGEVREVAEVILNDQPAGVVWKRPYRLDVSKLVNNGRNTIQVRVTNLLINEVLGQPQPDYAAVHAKFGQRFPDPTEWKTAKPLPAGLAGPVKLSIVCRE
jgi:hypothetical protein